MRTFYHVTCSPFLWLCWVAEVCHPSRKSSAPSKGLMGLHPESWPTCGGVSVRYRWRIELGVSSDWPLSPCLQTVEDCVFSRVRSQWHQWPQTSNLKFFCFCLFDLETLSYYVCSPGWLQTQDPLAWASWVLGLQVCITISCKYFVCVCVRYMCLYMYACRCGGQKSISCLTFSLLTMFGDSLLLSLELGILAKLADH